MPLKLIITWTETLEKMSGLGKEVHVNVFH
jgi:hypothetical protein